MTELHQALDDIERIRRQVAETTGFRGYGPISLAATSVMALLAGAAQACWLKDAALHADGYVALWLATGFVCGAMIVTEMVLRARRVHSGLANEMIEAAVLQFLPAAIAGVALPLVLLQVSHESVWMLPGLWQIVFSLGVFASCRSLPRPMLFVGAWFLLTGLVSISLGSTDALAPAAMSGSFAIGMAMVAAIHHHAARIGSVEADGAEEGEML